MGTGSCCSGPRLWLETSSKLSADTSFPQISAFSPPGDYFTKNSDSQLIVPALLMIIRATSNSDSISVIISFVGIQI